VVSLTKDSRGGVFFNCNILIIQATDRSEKQTANVIAAHNKFNHRLQSNLGAKAHGPESRPGEGPGHFGRFEQGQINAAKGPRAIPKRPGVNAKKLFFFVTDKRPDKLVDCQTSQARLSSLR
jgi:hypothetical protein